MCNSLQFIQFDPWSENLQNNYVFSSGANTAFMPNSWHKQVPLAMKQDRSFARRLHKVCYLHLCCASPVTFEKAMNATVHGVTFDSVAKNVQVVLIVGDIEDEIFWRVIFVF